jgi:hypothetical protein
MQQKIVPRRFLFVARRKRLGDLAVNAGLCAYFCLACALIGGSAFGFFHLMQPVIYPNSGGTAYSATTLPPDQLDFEARARSVLLPSGATAFASSEEKPAAPEPDPAKAKKSGRETATTDAKRKPAKKRDPTTNNADYRPWGDYQNWGQNWSGNRSSGYPVSNGYRPWGAYEAWGSARKGR